MKDLTLPTPAIKPCPFCGGEASARPRTCNRNTPYNPADRAFPIVRCGKCGAEAIGDDWKSEATAIEKWNRRAALSSNHEDGGRAATDKKSLTVAPVALGGEKGEAVAGEKLNELLDAYAEIAYQNGVEFCAGNEGDLEGELTAKRAVLALFADPVGKARMLTDEEADHITGMHNTGRSQGDSECAEAIQRKFCEVNGITLEAK